jgi:hypothetical protein
MKLTDEENSAESGIDVVASPPGKRLQSVLLLSGGEKALTALALLVGIFQYTPSPFCILDEVDAPLGRGQHRPLHRPGERDEHQDAVRAHHAQQEDDEHRACALRRNHAGAWRVEASLGPVRSSVGIGVAGRFSANQTLVRPLLGSGQESPRISMTVRFRGCRLRPNPPQPRYPLSSSAFPQPPERNSVAPPRFPNALDGQRFPNQ